MIYNSIKYTFKGEININIKDISDENYLEIEVSDTGTGISIEI